MGRHALWIQVPAKKMDCRTFLHSAELFPPNVVKQGLGTSMSEPCRVDEERSARVIEFIAGRRGKEDVVISGDGRARGARKLIEKFEGKLAASGAHAYVECWIVYKLACKSDDPRIPRKQAISRTTTKRSSSVRWRQKGAMAR